jgi:hypothetical protein
MPCAAISQGVCVRCLDSTVGACVRLPGSRVRADIPRRCKKKRNLCAAAVEEAVGSLLRRYQGSLKLLQLLQPYCHIKCSNCQDAYV